VSVSTTEPVRDSTCDLHAGAEPRIEPDDHTLAGRRREQQLLQVLAEDADRLVVGSRLELQPQLDGDRRREQPLVGVLCDQAELPHGAPRADDGALHQRRDLLDRRVDRPDEEAFGLAAADGEDAMRRDVAELLGELVVVLELGDLLLLARDDGAPHRAARARQLAHRAAQLRVLGDALAQDVARALQGVGHCRDLPRRVDVGRGGRLDRRVVRRCRPTAARPAARGRARARSWHACAASA
jgi:hypothetical protein